MFLVMHATAREGKVLRPQPLPFLSQPTPNDYTHPRTPHMGASLTALGVSMPPLGPGLPEHTRSGITHPRVASCGNPRATFSESSKISVLTMIA